MRSATSCGKCFGLGQGFQGIGRKRQDRLAQGKAGLLISERGAGVAGENGRGTTDELNGVEQVW